MPPLYRCFGVAAIALAPLALAAPALAVDEVVEAQNARVRVQTFADGLVHPWGLAFLPDGSALVTERPGRLRHVSPDGALSEPISGVPEMDARRQGGLLDVALDPNFSDNRLVYLSFAEPGEGGTTSTAVARGRLSQDNSALSDVEVIFTQRPKVASTMHYGSRLVFDREGRLYVTLGERFAEDFRDQAQELDSHLGKVVRINADGSVPQDNPFVGRDNALPEIWSYGHRNIQAAELHPETGELWTVEHGPMGGDEFNIPEAGANYGWPVVSHGVNYDGTPVGTGQQSAEGMVDPLETWTPSFGPSGMAVYTGDAFPEWQGDVFVGGLASESLLWLEMEGRQVAGSEPLLADLGLRIRDVVQGPEGAIFLLSDQENGEILRLSPAE
jgi:glucose/arabinose dehydrogenase